MHDRFTQDFAVFTRKWLEPAIAQVNRRKRSALFLALAWFAGMFILAAVGSYFLVQPYADVLQKYGMGYWLYIVLLPLPLACIVFIVVFLHRLRSAVRDFRTGLLSGMAELIDPELQYTPMDKLLDVVLEKNLLFPMGGIPRAGKNHFCGHVGLARVRLCNLRLEVKPTTATEGGDFAGVFLQAEFSQAGAMVLLMLPATAEVSYAELERSLLQQGNPVVGGLVRVEDTPGYTGLLLVSAGQEKWGRRFIFHHAPVLHTVIGSAIAISCNGRTVSASLCSHVRDRAASGMFTGFDFERCQDFCREARALLTLVKSLG